MHSSWDWIFWMTTMRLIERKNTFIQNIKKDQTIHLPLNSNMAWKCCSWIWKSVLVWFWLGILVISTMNVGYSCAAAVRGRVLKGMDHKSLVFIHKIIVIEIAFFFEKLITCVALFNWKLNESVSWIYILFDNIW